MSKNKRIFHPILLKLREALRDREQGGTILDAMAKRIAERAAADPTLMRGETFEQLTEAPQDID